MEHSSDQRFRKIREISEAAAMARSILHKKVRTRRASAIQSLQPTLTHTSQHKLETNSQRTRIDDGHSTESRSASSLSPSGIHKPIRTSETYLVLTVKSLHGLSSYQECVLPFFK